MKTVKVIITAAILILIASTVIAQSEAAQEDYFSGQWEVLVEGTPQGDATMIFDLNREEGKLVGTVAGKGQTDQTKFDRIEETDNSLTAYWFAQGYNVYIKLNKGDENNMSGSLMNMFTASAKRIQE